MKIEPVERLSLEKKEPQSVRLIQKELVVDNFAEKLRNLRIAKHLTQAQLAVQLGVPKHQVRRWETGKCIPNSYQLQELIRLFKVPSLYLVKPAVDKDSGVIVERETLKENKGEIAMNSLEVVSVTKPTFGENLKAARAAKGWNRRELSEKAGASYNTITNWETGVNTPPVAELLKLSNVLNVSACELLNVEPSTQKFEVTVKGKVTNTFAARLQVARLQKGFSKIQLANRLNVAAPSITSWENERTTPNVDVLMKLSNVLEAPLDFLLDGKMKRSNRAKNRVATSSLSNREDISRVNEVFSKRLKEHRLDHALSQSRLAKAIGMTPMMVYKWETGRAVPSKDSIQKLLNFFEMSLDDFLTPSSNEVPEKVEKHEVEILGNEEVSTLETPSVIVEFHKPAVEKPVESEVVEVKEFSEEFAQMVEGVTKEVQEKVAEVMNQLTQRVVSEVATLNQTSEHQLDLTDAEIKLMEQVRQLNEAEVAMLQSYLDYLTSKK